MKIFLFFAGTVALYGGACSGIDVGSSLYGHTSWHGFVPGSATSTYRQNVTNAPVDPNSVSWLTQLGLTAQSVFLNNPVSVTDAWYSGWSGYNVHYVHGNTQRRMIVRDNPTWSRTSVTGSMTAGSAVLTVPTWSITQGRQAPYFSQRDVGLSVSVTGACSGNNAPCYLNALGGNPGGVVIVSVQSASQATLSAPASVSVSSATVTVMARETYPDQVDPGTVPIPNVPRIQSWYGPQSRPFDGFAFLDRYMDPYTGGQNAPSDQHVFVVDVDNCIEYDMWGAMDDASNFSTSTYAAYYLPGGDLQRPYNLTGGATVAGLPELFGMLRYDEFGVGVIPHALNISALPGNISVAFTGAASHAQCCGVWASANIPFGAKLRLKPGFDSSAFPASCAPLITQMKTYGLIIVDGGYTGQLAQAIGNSWPYDCASYMYQSFRINANTFDVVQQANTQVYCVGGTSGCPNTLPTGNPPVISSFTASPSSIATGQSVMLHWSVSGVVDVDNNPIPLRNISYGVNPSLPCSSANPCKLGPGWIEGVSRGESVSITPPAPGTYVYQLMVQNRFGHTYANVTVTAR
jgi:hypothetical protein